MSRRSLLIAAAVTVAGCGKHHRPRPKPPATVPDATALAAARDLERMLIASYDAKIATAGPKRSAQLEVAKAIHGTHLAALHGAPAGSADTAVATNLHKALRQSVRTLRQLATAASSGMNAALFASIAASHEVSAEANGT
ncbi:MAG TPA: hypothetical protein VME70_08495 [Mycobacteriales bacterium]|nr:hypothetical protein [Mycobacteriales bacterium]